MLELKNRETGEEQHEIKLRAITLDYETAGKIHAERYRKMVNNSIRGEKDQIVVNKNVNFVVDPDKRGINSVPMEKTFKPSINKGVQIRKRIVPYGWNPCEICENTRNLKSHCACGEVNPIVLPSVG